MSWHRMALGAQASQVLLMNSRETAWLSRIGVGTGLGAALLLTQFVPLNAYGLKPTITHARGRALLLLPLLCWQAGDRRTKRR